MRRGTGNDSSWTPRRLLVTDVSDCSALSDEAGWNQTAEDWEFIIRHSESMGIESASGQVVATTVAYPGPGTRWIAMVLVSSKWRGQGLASRVLSQLDVGCVSGCTDYLDATRLGAPVYRKRGFEQVGIVNRYQGKAKARGNTGADLPEGMRHCLGPDGDQPWMTLDGISPWCPAVIGYSEAVSPDSCFLMEGPAGRGAIWARPGRLAWQVGPLVATDVCIAKQLLDACLNSLDGAVVVDVPSEANGMDSLLEERGFSVSREFERMCCGPQIAMNLSGLQRYATAGPDFG